MICEMVEGKTILRVQKPSELRLALDRADVDEVIIEKNWANVFLNFWLKVYFWAKKKKS